MLYSSFTALVLFELSIFYTIRHTHIHTLQSVIENTPTQIKSANLFTSIMKTLPTFNTKLFLYCYEIAPT